MSEYIVTCDDETASWIGNEVDSMEPVVRCRDCRHMHIERSWTGLDTTRCWLHADRETGALGKETVEPDGFCAWGERREDA